MKEGKRWLAALAAVATLLMPAGCDNEGRHNPAGGTVPSADYQVVLSYYFANNQYQTPFYLMIDGPRDSIAESLAFQTPFNAFQFLDKGTQAVFTIRGKTWLSAWPAGDVLASNATAGGTAINLTPDERYLFITGSKPVLFSLPDLTPLFQAGSGGDGTLIPGRRLACYHHWSDTLHFLDFRTGVAIHEKRVLRGLSGEVLLAGTVCASVSGDSLILSAELDNGQASEQYIIVAATADLSVFDQIPVSVGFQFTRPVVHPDGKRIFWCKTGGTWPTLTYGAVYTYDIEGKSLTMLLDGSSTHLFPKELRLSPRGDYLYVLSANDLSLAKVRLSDGETTLLVEGFPGYGECMAIK